MGARLRSCLTLISPMRESAASLLHSLKIPDLAVTCNGLQCLATVVLVVQVDGKEGII